MLSEVFTLTITVVSNGYEVCIEKWNDESGCDENIARFIAPSHAALLDLLCSHIPTPLSFRNG